MRALLRRMLAALRAPSPRLHAWPYLRDDQALIERELFDRDCR